MQRYEEQVTQTLSYPLATKYPLSDILFFDIETTGFQAEVSSLYLIGVMYFEHNAFHIVQYFADDYQCEQELLEAFLSLLVTKKVLIHFNGTGFDLPYLHKKCKQCSMDKDFTTALSQCQSIDLYKKITPYKEAFQLPNYKQKTVEQFLQIPRNDTYSGGELIEVYGQYLKKKFAYEDNTKELHLLLLHNKEDVLGMLQLVQLFYYLDVFEEPLPITQFEISQTSDALTLSYTNKDAYRSSVHFKTNQFDLRIEHGTLTITIPMVERELKYFYPNHKDYYYLPKEDQAVHKSVAEYVDKEYREKAKASTCYMRKTGRFLPGVTLDNTTLFKEDYKAKDYYMEYHESLLTNHELFATYIMTLLQSGF